MTREIKFRAWLPAIEKMAHPLYITEIAKEVYCAPKEIVWLQFTGLRDKNSKEIYEGDICRQIQGGREWVGKVAISPTQGVIVGVEGNWWPIWPNDVEVIGNIYEHPDLLGE